MKLPMTIRRSAYSSCGDALPPSSYLLSTDFRIYAICYTSTIYLSAMYLLSTPYRLISAYTSNTTTTNKNDIIIYSMLIRRAGMPGDHPRFTRADAEGARGGC